MESPDSPESLARDMRVEPLELELAFDLVDLVDPTNGGDLLERVRALLPLCWPMPVEVEASALGLRAALVGAAALGLSWLHNALFGADAPDGYISRPPADAVSLKEAAQ